MNNLRKSLNSFLLKKKFSQLEKICTHALLDNSDKNIYLEYRAIAFLYQKKIEKYLQDIRQLLKIDDDNLFANTSMANYCFSKKEYENAKTYIEKAIKNKSNSKIYKLYVEILIALKNFTAAEKIINKSKELFPDDLIFNFLLSDILEKLQKIPESIKNLQELEIKLPSNIIIKSKLAELYLKLENFELAEEIFLKVLKIDPSHLHAIIKIIWINKVKGEFDKARAMLGNALSNHPYNSVLVSYEIDLNKNIDVNRINEIIKNTDQLSSIDRSIVYFAISKYFNTKKKYKEFSLYLKKANNLKRSLFSNYNVEQHIEEQKKIRNYQTKDRFIKFFNKKKIEHMHNNPIFVVGMPRSGSTLVEQILSSHSKIEGLGEINCFRETLESYFGDISFSALIDQLQDKEDSNFFIKMGNDYLNRIKKLKKTDSTFFVDKMLMNYQFVSLIKICIPQSKFIFCKRDKLENCFSIFKLDFQTFMPWAYCPNELKKIYDEHLVFFNYFKTFMKDDIYEMDYENLVNNFEQEVKKLLDFVRVPMEESCYNFHENKRLVLTASNEQVRSKIYNTSINTNKECKFHFPEIFN